MESKGLATGLTVLDNIINFPKTGVLVVTTKPGVGKTMMMTQMAIESAKIGNKVGFISFDTRLDIMRFRILSYYSNRNLRKEYCYGGNVLEDKKLKSELLLIEREEGCNILLKNILFFQTSNMVNELLLKLKEAVDRTGVNIIFIDYLQLISFGSVDPYASLLPFWALLNTVKDFANDNNILIVLGSQLTKYDEILASIKDKTDTIIVIENISRNEEVGELKISVIKNRGEGTVREIDCDINYGTGRLYEHALAMLREFRKVAEKNEDIEPIDNDKES